MSHTIKFLLDPQDAFGLDVKVVCTSAGVCKTLCLECSSWDVAPGSVSADAPVGRCSSCGEPLLQRDDCAWAEWIEEVGAVESYGGPLTPVVEGNITFDVPSETWKYVE